MKSEIFIILGIIGLIFVFYFVGKSAENGIINKVLLEGVDNCQDQGQVLRVFRYNDEARVECFGEIPITDLHIIVD